MSAIVILMAVEKWAILTENYIHVCMQDGTRNRVIGHCQLKMYQMIV